MKEEPMRFERLRINIIAAALMFARTLSASPASPAPSNAAWESLKTLQGEWEGVYEGSMKTRVGYRLVSNGTALMETLVSPESGDMVTMYHADGPGVAMTHYCSQNTQSRMRASAADPKRIIFSFVDVANAPSPDSMRMTGLVVTLQSPDRFTQEWTSTAGGKSETGRFEFTRKREK
jgi:hypothetical protein